ncbi:MAG TPA: hypothetical protein VN578_07885 [Candidatus Binatia bacterium]|jgi:hypothetical protein|nr:hypothetical protein [Candidatus Binatia bacterium]
MNRLLLCSMAIVFTTTVAGAATFQEDFATDPLARGWRVFGDRDLFHWNPTSQNLEVTWDSSQTNSYFQFLPGTIVARDDDFSFGLDLRLDDIAAGVNPSKPSTFELAFGLQNLVNAQGTNFLRSTGTASANLVELDFFPDTGFGPTVSPAVWSTNSLLNYNGPEDFTIMDLPVGVPMRITLSYTASNQTLSTTITTNGVSIGAVHDVRLSPSFTDFRVGTFAIESYSDAGQDPRYGGSLLAHGVVDNVVLTVPPNPVKDLNGGINHGVWQVQFVSRSNWVYTLERTMDFQTWTAASGAAPGNGGGLVLEDTNSPAARAFYRVRAERP